MNLNNSHNMRVI